MNFGEFIRAKRREKHMSGSDVATQLGITKQGYSYYEQGKRKINIQTAMKIADILEISQDEMLRFLSGEDIPTTTTKQNTATKSIQSNSINNVVSSRPIHMIPVYGSVSAGFGATAVDDVLDYYPAYIQGNPEDYLYIDVVGNSMQPKIPDGSRILVRKQSMCDNGEVAVVLIENTDAVVKKVLLGYDYITLISFNPEYPPRTFKGKELDLISIVGKVISVTSPI